MSDVQVTESEESGWVFDATASTYSYANALLLARLSALVYASMDAIRAEAGSCGWDFDAKKDFIDAGDKLPATHRFGPWLTSTQAIVLRKEGCVVVAFRGSEAKADDWAVDLSAHLCDGAGGSVHEGFWLALDAVWERLVGRLRALEPASLWLTGHSLGGALAAMMAARLQFGAAPDNKAGSEDSVKSFQARLRGIYTFGQPRIGNWRFATHFEDVLGAKFFRFVNDDDIVPRVPPPSMGFVHVGRKLYFDRVGALSERDRGADLVGAHLRGRLDEWVASPTRPIADHDIDDYIAKLRENKSFMPEVRSDATAEQMIRKEWTTIGHDPENGAPLFGLAFSGGGIRSATFNLGLMQTLASCRLLEQMHYLSTVSGGGYIGSWLSAWLCRTALSMSDATGADARDKNVCALKRIESRLGGTGRESGGQFNDAAEAREITWLRRFSNYLTPHTGLFSSDTLAAVSIWLRNTLLNQLLLCTGFILLMLALWFPGATLQEGGPRIPQAGVRVLDAVWVVALFWGFWKAWMETRAANGGNVGQWTRSKAATMIFGAAWLILPILLAWSFSSIGKIAADNSLLFLSLAPSLTLLSAFITGAIIVALCHDWLSEIALEWWARANGGLLHLAVVWLVFSAITLFGPFVLEKLWPWVKAAGGLTWFVTTIVGAMSAMGGRNGKDEAGGVRGWLAIVAPYVFVIGLLGLLSLAVHAYIGKGDTATSSATMSCPARKDWTPQYRASMQDTQIVIDATSGVEGEILCEYSFRSARSAVAFFSDAAAWISMSGLVLLFLLLGGRVDINRFSLHFLYRNRLERCYLGASNAKRRPNYFTGLCLNDAPALTGLKDVRPYPLINAALNITHETEATSTDRLGWQERKSASFLFSPLYCGYRLAYGERGVDAFQETGAFNAGKQPISLGMAMSISGAAASPNSGYHTRAGTAFLLTLFNARLGWWLQNSRREKYWRGWAPTFSPMLLFWELMGWSNDSDRFVYVSDGGHFENLGIYELVRRRCAVIIVSDVSCDEKFEFEDLGNAVRKCRTDFGVDIELDPRGVVPGDDGVSQCHCAVGLIRYPETEELPAKRGQILYIKPSLTGNEPADVLQYAKANPSFPHQSTADQWFNESQFESYRKLGQHIGQQVLGDQCAHQLSTYGIVAMLDRLWRRWYRPSSRVNLSMGRHSERLENLFDTLREDASLALLDAQLLADWHSLVPRDETNTARASREILYFCAKLFQLMEDVYIDLHLMEDSVHPDVQGWINLFKQWVRAPLVREAWALYGCTYGQRFRDFCQDRLGMPDAKPRLSPGSMGVRWKNLDTARPEWLVRSGQTYFDSQQENYEDVYKAYQFDIWSFSLEYDALQLPLGYAVVARSDSLTSVVVDFSLRPHLRGMGLARPMVNALKGEYKNLSYRPMLAGGRAQGLYDTFQVASISPAV